MMRNIGKRFAGDRRGNFSLIGVLAFPVVFSGVALSVDVMNHLRVRTDLQNANDTAVLYATRYYQEEKVVPNVAMVTKFITANYPYPVQNVTVAFDNAKNEMTVNSESVQKPMVMNYFGNHTGVVAAESKATLGVAGILEFALALDTTESMNYEGRIHGLKIAAKNFVDLLFDVKDRGADVKGAIVPFSRYVNVGIDRRNESWIDVPADIDTRKSEVKSKKETPIVSWTNCQTHTYGPQTIHHPATGGWTENRDGVSIFHPGSPAWTENRPGGSWQQCDPVYGSEQTVTWTETSGKLITWNGCVGSRDYPYNLKESYGSKKFSGLMDVTCASELQPLTNNRSLLLNKISSLSTSDNTYIPDGVMWGIRTLTNALPFNEAKPDQPAGSMVKKDRKALVIMTDGANTLSPNPPTKSGKNNMSPNSSWHDDGVVSLADQYTVAACNEAKELGMEVYTITFGDQVPVNIRQLLENCASKRDFSFHASNSNALDKAFKDIADQLLSVRLSQ